MNELRKILIVFCGGTISMHKNESTGALDVAHGADQLFNLEPRIVDLAKIEVHELSNIDSTNLSPSEWEALANVVQDNYDKYDGFVITMGTNTMAYASSALSFAMQNLGKPVVLTGAQIPAEAISTDARNNLVNALRVAAMDISGVFIVFGSKIMLGCRAKKLSESDLDAFGSFNDVDFGEISIGIKLNQSTAGRHNEKPLFKNKFDANIISLTCIPGLPVDYLHSLVDNGTKGVVLRGFGSGDIPYSYLPFLEYAREKEVPVVVTTQCRGSTVLGLNDPGLKALRAGAIQAFDMSMESMSAKMMWLLGQRIAYADFKSAFHKNMCGEINIKRTRFFINKELEKLIDYQSLDTDATTLGFTNYASLDEAPQKIRDAVRLLVQTYDREFIPPLSVRHGPKDTKLDPGSQTAASSTEAYFCEMAKQPVLIATYKENAIGFMSYKLNYDIPETAKKATAYVSTIIVDDTMRGRKITARLYDKLFDLVKGHSGGQPFSVATRTWNTNFSHLTILQRLGFKRTFNHQDGRGSGIDTVIYEIQLAPQEKEGL